MTSIISNDTIQLLLIIVALCVGFMFLSNRNICTLIPNIEGLLTKEEEIKYKLPPHMRSDYHGGEWHIDGQVDEDAGGLGLMSWLKGKNLPMVGQLGSRRYGKKIYDRGRMVDYTNRDRNGCLKGRRGMACRRKWRHINNKKMEEWLAMPIEERIAASVAAKDCSKLNDFNAQEECNNLIELAEAKP
tara:strand:+ start:369 stop:929 length:561 start_codon:yes stop_codon:yes gene_type:complete